MTSHGGKVDIIILIFLNQESVQKLQSDLPKVPGQGVTVLTLFFLPLCSEL